MKKIKIQNLCKSYGEHPVFKNINKTVNAGEFVTLVGASGCGKTTFLKILLGSESATSGQVTIDDSTIKAEPSVDRGIVFQKYSVFPHLTVLDNVLIGAEFKNAPVFSKLFGSSYHTSKQQALALLNAMGLDHVLNRYPHHLSGGMQQRLSLAQSIFKAPKLLLLDEPFGALDPGIRKDMHELIMSLWKDNELTIFMVTHDIQEGFKLGSRLWVFDKLLPQTQENTQKTADHHLHPAVITYDLPLNKEPKVNKSSVLTSKESASIIKATLSEQEAHNFQQPKLANQG